jgi:mycothiol synthase
MPNPAPLLPDGYTVRPARLDEVDALAHLFTVDAAERGLPEYTAEELSIDLQTPGLELEKDTRVAVTAEGALAAYADVWTILSVNQYPTVWGSVHPEHRDRGLGSHLLDWGIARAHHVMDDLPPGARVAARSFVTEDWEPARRLLEDAGFRLFRHSLDMRVELDGEPPAPEWPDGIVLTPYDHPKDAEAAYHAIDESFSDHFGHVKVPFEEDFALFRHREFEDEEFDPAFWFFAMDGDEIAGIACCRRRDWSEKDLGWVTTLGVRRPWRRRGIALALLRECFVRFHAHGRTAAGLSVDASNLTGAVRLYEKAGMHIHRRHDRYELELRPGRDLGTT